MSLAFAPTGHLAFYDEDWQSAESFYRRAIAADPLNLERQGNLAVVFYATMRMDQFNDLCKTVEGMHDKPAAFYDTVDTPHDSRQQLAESRLPIAPARLDPHPNLRRREPKLRRQPWRRQSRWRRSQALSSASATPGCTTAPSI